MGFVEGVPDWEGWIQVSNHSMRIPGNEVEFHPHSFGDPQVRLFRWRGEIYRGISSQHALFYRRLFEDKVIERAVDKGLLIDSELTELVVDGYELVVHHRQIAFAS